MGVCQMETIIVFFTYDFKLDWLVVYLKNILRNQILKKPVCTDQLANQSKVVNYLIDHVKFWFMSIW